MKFQWRQRHSTIYAGKPFRQLYIPVTNNLARRINEHKEGLVPGFTKRYRIHRLVYFEEFDLATDAIAREKQLKGWSRKRKIALIESLNPSLKDLAVEWLNHPLTSEK